MKQIFRALLGFLLACWYVATGKRQRMLRAYDDENKILSIVGHDPTPEMLEKILRWIADRGFIFVSTDQLLSKDLPKGRKAWLTFDDGWKSFKTFLPIFEKLNIPVTLFIAPYETRRGQVWTNSVRPYGADIHSMYKMDAKKRYEICDEILSRVGNTRRLLTEEEVIMLSRHPLITIENHTMTHLSCANHSKETITSEIKEAAEVIEKWTGRKTRLCCYPFGFRTEATDRAVIESGHIPVTCDAGEMEVDTIGKYRNMFKDKYSVAESICRALGAWRKVKVPDIWR